MKRLIVSTIAAALLLVPALSSAKDASLVQLAETALRAGQLEAAADIARAAIVAQPDDPGTYLVLGLALDRQGHFEAAAEAYRVVARMSVAPRRALLLLGRALRQAGDIDGSLRAFSAAAAVGQPPTRQTAGL